ncbi:archaellin/type IV pilin N-terminal domain-containing protein, partial [Candidatus Nitrosotenuis cloacae]|uniref:archaellin/type IV pilin N-terminal domain-containing protein n=1 Tax=Candidatus Nitrosotenuis cloacae TaxID=1603555 RepID=UPI00228153A6
VESAIVMIAFVIVAAALAFVVLNMGFSTTQKAKTTIGSSLGEASSSLEIAGKVTALGNVTQAKLEVIGIPIKIASGGESVNLNAATAAVKYISNSVEYDNIYAGTLTEATDGDDDNGSGEWLSMELATDDAADADLYITEDPYDANGIPASTKAFVYWTVNNNNNDILDQGEHAVLAIAFRSADQPSALDKVRAEILIPTGAALSIERQVPSVTTTVVDLG